MQSHTFLSGLNGKQEMDQFIVSPEARSIVQSAEATEVEIGEIKPSAEGQDRLYRWELINKERISLIHIFPTPPYQDDLAFLYRMREALRLSIIRNLSHLRPEGRWVKLVDSFNISYTKAIGSTALARQFLEDFREEFYRRIT